MHRRKGKKSFLTWIVIAAAIIIAALMFGAGGPGSETNTQISEDGEYSSYLEVAEYINTYHHLPSNYVTKGEAHDRGWYGGNPEKDLGEGVCIGGDRFRNSDHLLPEDETYYECDVDYSGSSRGAKRLIYTRDGKVYYTDNHYGDASGKEHPDFDDAFERLY